MAKVLYTKTNKTDKNKTTIKTLKLTPQAEKNNMI